MRDESALLGVLGGTFNPPHFGHARAALETRDALGLGGVLWLPSGQHPFKPSATLAPLADRLDMTAALIGDTPGFVVCDLEARHPGIGYTVPILETLTREHPGRELVFLLGGDILTEIHKWYRWQELLDHAHLAVLTRPGHPPDPQQCPALPALVAESLPAGVPLQRRPGGRHQVVFVTVTGLDISSRAIRALVASGRDPGYLTHERVIGIMNSRQLYRHDPGKSAAGL
ncbi:MAG: nicotinate (nicotinamide) nucleotide adenylyltransferase [Magnetococcus sp. WYHC-3]